MTKSKDKLNKDKVKTTKLKSPVKCPKVLNRCRTKAIPVQLMDKMNIRTMGLDEPLRQVVPLPIRNQELLLLKTNIV